MSKLVDLYSFTDIAVNSGAPYNIQVDLQALLAQISKKVISGAYSSDYDFQVDLMNMMNPLFDAHTLYRAPNGYSCFFLRPFNIEASQPSSGNGISYKLRTGPLASRTNDIWRAILNFDPSPYVNKEVVQINGKSTTDHLLLVAQNFISTYKDEGVRFNAVLRMRWAQTILSMFPLTDSNLDYTSTYVFADGTSVEVPNAAFCGGGVNSTQTLLARNRAPFFSASATESAKLVEHLKKNMLIQGIDVHKEYEQMLDEMLKSVGAKTVKEEVSKRNVVEKMEDETITVLDYSEIHQKVGPEFLETKGFNVPRSVHSASKMQASGTLTVINYSKAQDCYFMKYVSGGQTTYVLKLTTFAPKDVNDTLLVINSLITDAQFNRGSKLIVDVANNGGGIICLSDLLLALLVPEWGSLQPSQGPTVPYGLYDYKQSKTALALRSHQATNQAFTSYQNYLNPQTELPFTNPDHFYSPILRTRAGRSSNYTQQAYFPAGCVGYPGAYFQPIQYYFKNITVLTDGACGSACALFASQLQSEKLARVVSFGGPEAAETNPTPLSTASFAGGNVLEYNTVSLYVFLNGLSGDKNLPPMMSSSAASRFNFNEYYELDNLNTPREYLKRPAVQHINYWAPFYNDIPTTTLGNGNLATLYGTVVTQWK